MDNILSDAESASSRRTRIPADAIPPISAELGSMVPADLRTPIDPEPMVGAPDASNQDFLNSLPADLADELEFDQPDSIDISSDTASEVADLPDLSEAPLGMDIAHSFDFGDDPVVSTERPRQSPLAAALGLPADESVELDTEPALPVDAYIDPEDPGYAALGNVSQPDPLATLNPLDDLSGFAPDAHLHSQPHAPAQFEAQSLLTPEERAANIERIISLERAATQGASIVLELRPMDKLEADLREVCENAAAPEVAEILISQIRQAVHEVVTTHPGLKEPGNTGAGINARLEALRALDEALKSTVHPFLDKLSAEGVNVVVLGTALDDVLEAEKANLKDREKSLLPQTLGSRIFNGLVDQTQRLFAGPSPLAGEVRRRRDNDLRSSLRELEEVTKEIKANCGNEEWMRTTGPQAMALAESLMVNIGESTKGVEKQIDHVALNTALSSASKNLKDASEETADQSAKERIKKMVEAFNAFIERLTNVVRKAVGLSEANPELARPAMRPMPRGTH